MRKIKFFHIIAILIVSLFVLMACQDPDRDPTRTTNPPGGSTSGGATTSTSGNTETPPQGNEPRGVMFSDGILTWDAVTDADYYEIKVGDQTVTTEALRFNVFGLDLEGNQQVELRAVTGRTKTDAYKLAYAFNSLNEDVVNLQETIISVINPDLRLGLERVDFPDDESYANYVSMVEVTSIFALNARRIGLFAEELSAIIQEVEEHGMIDDFNTLLFALPYIKEFNHGVYRLSYFITHFIHEVTTYYLNANDPVTFDPEQYQALYTLNKELKDTIYALDGDYFLSIQTILHLLKNSQDINYLDSLAHLFVSETEMDIVYAINTFNDLIIAGTVKSEQETIDRQALLYIHKVLLYEYNVYSPHSPQPNAFYEIAVITDYTYEMMMSKAAVYLPNEEFEYLNSVSDLEMVWEEYIAASILDELLQHFNEWAHLHTDYKYVLIREIYLTFTFDEIKPNDRNDLNDLFMEYHLEINELERSLSENEETLFTMDRNRYFFEQREQYERLNDVFNDNQNAIAYSFETVLNFSIDALSSQWIPDLLFLIEEGTLTENEFNYMIDELVALLEEIRPTYEEIESVTRLAYAFTHLIREKDFSADLDALIEASATTLYLSHDLLIAIIDALDPSVFQTLMHYVDELESTDAPVDAVLDLVLYIHNQVDDFLNVNKSLVEQFKTQWNTDVRDQMLTLFGSIALEALNTDYAFEGPISKEAFKQTIENIVSNGDLLEMIVKKIASNGKALYLELIQTEGQIIRDFSQLMEEDGDVSEVLVSLVTHALALRDIVITYDEDDIENLFSFTYEVTKFMVAELLEMPLADYETLATTVLPVLEEAVNLLLTIEKELIDKVNVEALIALLLEDDEESDLLLLGEVINTLNRVFTVELEQSLTTWIERVFDDVLSNADIQTIFELDTEELATVKTEILEMVDLVLGEIRLIATYDFEDLTEDQLQHIDDFMAMFDGESNDDY